MVWNRYPHMGPARLRRLTVSVPNSPLHQTTLAMLHEALDTCPSLARYYRARLVARLGSDAQEVLELDRRNRRRDEWLPSFP